MPFYTHGDVLSEPMRAEHYSLTFSHVTSPRLPFFTGALEGCMVWGLGVTFCTQVNWGIVSGLVHLRNTFTVSEPIENIINAAIPHMTKMSPRGRSI